MCIKFCPDCKSTKYSYDCNCQYEGKVRCELCKSSDERVKNRTCSKCGCSSKDLLLVKFDFYCLKCKLIEEDKSFKTQEICNHKWETIKLLGTPASLLNRKCTKCKIII